MKIEKLVPIITRTKKGKELIRYDAVTQKSNDKLVPNMNIGVTPKGTRYCRSLLPDKSWGSTYLLKKDGSQSFVDLCSSNYGIQASVINKKPNGVVKSDKFVDHKIFPKGSQNVVISTDKKVGQMVKTYVQKDFVEAMNFLTNSFDMFKAPAKEGFWKRFWKAIT